jgi:hypothetical protein
MRGNGKTQPGKIGMIPTSGSIVMIDPPAA